MVNLYPFFPAACAIGVDSCTDGSCNCNTGYTGRDCCDCAVGFYRDGEQCLGGFSTQMKD